MCACTYIFVCAYSIYVVCVCVRMCQVDAKGSVQYHHGYYFFKVPLCVCRGVLECEFHGGDNGLSESNMNEQFDYNVANVATTIVTVIHS